MRWKTEVGQMNAPYEATDLLYYQPSAVRGWTRTSEHPMLAGRKELHSAATLFGVQSLVICLLIVASALEVSAQTASTGALIGTVTDPTGAVLQAAQIALRNTGTGESRTAVTGEDGSYRFSLLAPGEYELTVEAVGFAPLVVREVLIRI